MKPDVRAASLSALEKLLQEVVTAPKAFIGTPIHKHLGSQGLLADYADEVRGITSCSLNTLKRSSVSIAGGFEALDRMRRRALECVSSTADAPERTDKSTKRALAKRLADTSRNLETAHEDLALLTFLLQRAMRHGRQYAAQTKSTAVIARCEADQAEIADMMARRRTTVRHLNVVRNDYG